jgi:hypothetical protein
MKNLTEKSQRKCKEETEKQTETLNKQEVKDKKQQKPKILKELNLNALQTQEYKKPIGKEIKEKHKLPKEQMDLQQS